MMLWLRSSLYALGLLITTPLFSVLALLAFPLPPLTRSRFIALWSQIMLWWMKLTCGLSYRVVGAENIPDHPCIILAKHQSAWETMAFQCVFPPVVWVMKKELLKIPFFGWGLAMTSPIAIDRSAGKEALRQITEQGKAAAGKRLLGGGVSRKARESSRASAGNTILAAPFSPRTATQRSCR